MQAISSSPFGYESAFRVITGKGLDAVFLSYCISLYRASRGDFQFNPADCLATTGLSRQEQSTSLSRLTKKGVLVSNDTGTVRVDIDRLEAIMSDKDDFVDAKTEKDAFTAFVDLWKREYEIHFGVPYAMNGNKDAAAVKRLTKIADAPFLVGKARAAWENITLFHCKRAGSIAGFAAAFNDITAELQSFKGNSSTTAGDRL